MSKDMEDLVETSLNIGVIRTQNMTNDTSSRTVMHASADPVASDAPKAVVLQFAVRSSVASAKRHLIDELCAISKLAGAETEVSGDYPGWKYEPESPLRDHMIAIYREMYGKEPIVKAIHAGLECGFFVSGMPGLDCVSIGPDMSDVHTTSESLSISSVGRTWDYLCSVLETM
jgi:dipeptidase D